MYTYKQLCDLTGAEYRRGKGQELHIQSLKEDGLARFLNIEKIGRSKYLIKEIYEAPLEIFDRRSLGNARKIVKDTLNNCFKIDNISIAHSPGVYKIENDKYVYIGSTIVKFTRRFAQHYYNYNGNHDKTQEVLLNGGTFECLQYFENGTDEQTIRECEAEYIRKYRNTDKTLLNDTIPEVLSKKEKIEYETIRIPKQYLDDIQDVLIDAGYLIMNKTVFNKKFIDE